MMLIAHQSRGRTARFLSYASSPAEGPRAEVASCYVNAVAARGQSALVVTRTTLLGRVGRIGSRLAGEINGRR